MKSANIDSATSRGENGFEGGALRSAVAHDYLTQRGGAERVVLEICHAIEARDVITALYEPSRTFREFSQLNVRASFLNRLSILRKDPRKAIGLLAAAWRFRRPVDADVVVCSSSGWAHALRVSANTTKIVYCHNPARWIYQTKDYLKGQSRIVRLALHMLRPFLLAWDRRAARTADLYIANSTSVAERIRQAYGVEPIVLFPPVTVDTLGQCDHVPEAEGSFFLMVGRARGYKGASALIDAFTKLPEKKLLIVGGEKLNNLPGNIKSLGFVSEENLRWLYKNATALISVSREDFGLTPIEANSFGTPVLLLRAGGFLDSTHEGVSGRFIENDSALEIERAVREFPDKWDKEKILEHAKNFGKEEFGARLRSVISIAVQEKIDRISCVSNLQSPRV